MALVGILMGRPTLLMIETAIALGVAAVPEGLPIVATIALASGMWLMARCHVLVNRLTAVEQPWERPASYLPTRRVRLRKTACRYSAS